MRHQNGPFCIPFTWKLCVCVCCIEVYVLLIEKLFYQFLHLNWLAVNSSLPPTLSEKCLLLLKLWGGVCILPYNGASIANWPVELLLSKYTLWEKCSTCNFNILHCWKCYSKTGSRVCLIIRAFQHLINVAMWLNQTDSSRSKLSRHMKVTSCWN